jgi:hypothetical protein
VVNPKPPLGYGAATLVKCLQPTSQELKKNKKTENQSKKKAKPNPNLN